MSSLVPTVIRLPKEEMEKYKSLAKAEGLSFSAYIYDSLIERTMYPSKKTSKKFLFDPREFKKYKSGDRDGAINHDKYIYTEDWKTKK
ncbi:MAG: hypothetical protein HYU80_04515 [Candidatus Blackburnbacteria bacterium]|nr:hypothetical protein [Candidatus Blackburnbacteria bacterium]